MLLLFDKVCNATESWPEAACNPDCKIPSLGAVNPGQGSVITKGSVTSNFRRVRLWSNICKTPWIAIKEGFPNIVRKASLSPKAKERMSCCEFTKYGVLSLMIVDCGSVVKSASAAHYMTATLSWTRSYLVPSSHSIYSTTMSGNCDIIWRW